MQRDPDIDFVVPAKLFYLPAVGHFAKALFSRHPLLRDKEEFLAYYLELAVYEACANVVRHAYEEPQEGKLRLRIWFNSDRVVIQVIDFGPGFDPQSIPDPHPENPSEGGMGLYIIRAAVDRFSYSPSQQEGNVLQVEKYLT